MLKEKVPRVVLILRQSRRLDSTAASQRSSKFKEGSKNSEEHEKPKKEKFSKLVIWGGNTTRSFTKDFKPATKSEYQVLQLPQEWTKLWPSAHTASNLVPLPLRQGHVKNITENSGLVPDRFGNFELMKIPNFLHLTPVHIKKHCNALKPFLTSWPSGLQSPQDIKQHYPIEVVSRDFVFSSASIRDERARAVTVRIPVSRLRLDLRQLEKLRTLAGPDRFELAKDGAEVLVLKSERCPTRKQNYDYLMYVLTALTAESKKKHAWEKELTEEDWRIFRWEGSASQEAVRRIGKDSPEDTGPLERYKAAVTDLRNSGETLDRMEEYKNSVKQLLGLKSAAS